MTPRDSTGRFCKKQETECPYTKAKEMAWRFVYGAMMAILLALGLFVLSIGINGGISQIHDTAFDEGKAEGYALGYEEGKIFADNYTNCHLSEFDGYFTICDIRSDPDSELWISPFSTQVVSKYPTPGNKNFTGVWR